MWKGDPNRRQRPPSASNTPTGMKAAPLRARCPRNCPLPGGGGWRPGVRESPPSGASPRVGSDCVAMKRQNLPHGPGPGRSIPFTRRHRRHGEEPVAPGNPSQAPSAGRRQDPSVRRMRGGPFAGDYPGDRPIDAGRDGEGDPPRLKPRPGVVIDNHHRPSRRERRWLRKQAKGRIESGDHSAGVRGEIPAATSQDSGADGEEGSGAKRLGQIWRHVAVFGAQGMTIPLCAGIGRSARDKTRVSQRRSSSWAWRAWRPDGL